MHGWIDGICIEGFDIGKLYCGLCGMRLMVWNAMEEIIYCVDFFLRTREGWKEGRKYSAGGYAKIHMHVRLHTL